MLPIGCQGVMFWIITHFVLIISGERSQAEEDFLQEMQEAQAAQGYAVQEI